MSLIKKITLTSIIILALYSIQLLYTKKTTAIAITASESTTIASPNYSKQNREAILKEKILHGELGKNIQNIAKKLESADNLKFELIKTYSFEYLSKPYEVYYFNTYKGVVTFIVDDEELVLLSFSFGGYAHSFKLSDSKLHFKFDEGSGIQNTYESVYTIGSKTSPPYPPFL